MPQPFVRFFRPILALGVTALLAACGSSHGRGDADAGPTGDGAVRRDGGSAVDSGPVPRVDGGITPGVDAGVRSCGGFAEESCTADEWCDYPDGSYCGGDDTPGVCRPRPTACDFLYDPVCGCDGETYSNECAANSVGVDVASRGECEPSGGVVCTNDRPCTGGAVCIGSGCGMPWRCVEVARACTDDAAPHCGCDGETFYDSSTCPTQPFVFAGSCEEGVDCDHRFVACDSLPPTCPPGQIASVSGACWGPCVDAGYCRCETADECPGEYVCHGTTGRCGPPVGG